MSEQKNDEQVDFETFKRVLFAKDSAYKSFDSGELKRMYANKHPLSLVANQKAIEENASKSNSKNSDSNTPPIVKFFYFLMVINFIAGIAGVIMATSNNSDDPNKQLGIYLAIAGISAGISSIVGAVFFTMLNELVYYFRSVHEILRKKNG